MVVYRGTVSVSIVILLKLSPQTLDGFIPSLMDISVILIEFHNPRGQLSLQKESTAWYFILSDPCG